MARMTETEWNREAGYIESVANTWGTIYANEEDGRAFNWDRECFRRYCSMQWQAAEREGFSDAAQRINVVGVSF